MSLNPNTLGHLSLMHRKFEKFKVVLPIPASKILFRTIMRQNVTCRKSDNNSKSSSEVALKKGPWTPEEDIILVSYVQQHGASNWRSVPAKTGLLRCSKSCRLRWTNYLRPGIKRGNFTEQEQKMIIHLKALLGNSPSGTVQKASGFNPAAKVALANLTIHQLVSEPGSSRFCVSLCRKSCLTEATRSGTGEYDWWKDQFKAHVCSLDGKLW
ncbi:unnamed protein product [Rhodiola kirilowii]